MNNKCIKAGVCQCASCEINGTEMCSGCMECTEHKFLSPVNNCSIIVKDGDWSGFAAVSVGGKYYIVVPMGIFDVPESFPIDKEEFQCFDMWKNNEEKIIEIQNRKYTV